MFTDISHSLLFYPGTLFSFMLTLLSGWHHPNGFSLAAFTIVPAKGPEVAVKGSARVTGPSRTSHWAEGMNPYWPDPVMCSPCGQPHGSTELKVKEGLLKGTCRSSKGETLPTSPPTSFYLFLTLSWEVAGPGPEALTPLPLSSATRSCRSAGKRSSRSGPPSPSWCCFSRDCWVRATKRYAEAGWGWGLESTSAGIDTGYKAHCDTLVFGDNPFPSLALFPYWC